MHPDRPAVQEMSNPGTNALDQLPGAFERIAGEINHNVGIELQDAVAELACRFRFGSVDSDLLDALPGAVRRVGLPPTAAHIQHGMAGIHQTRNKERANMPGATDNDDAQRGRSDRLRRCPQHGFDLLRRVQHLFAPQML